MTALGVDVLGVGVFAPGLSGWARARAVLAGEVAYAPLALDLPTPMALPAAERRRMGLTLKLAIATGFDALSGSDVDPAALATVFSSTGGDSENCHVLLETLASDDRALSPTRFHNSVHNMPAGYWHIATGSRAASTSLCAFDATFSVALLEAAVQVTCSAQPVLVVAYDTAYPQPLYTQRPIESPMAVGMLLAPMGAAARACASLTLRLSDAAPDTMGDAGLEALRLGVPSGRALPLLAALASRHSKQVVIDGLHAAHLDVEVRSSQGHRGAVGNG